MKPKEYAEKILSFDEKEKALLFVIDNYFEIVDEEGNEKEQSKFIKETITSSEELIKLKEKIYDYYNEVENSDELNDKYDISDEEVEKFIKTLKLDWFKEQ
jgi:hypothetical protein